MKRKKTLCAVIFFILIAVPTFASSVEVPDMMKVINGIIDLLKGPLMTGVFVLGLIKIGYDYLQQKHDEEQTKKLKKAFIGVALIFAAPHLAGIFITQGALL